MGRRRHRSTSARSCGDKVRYPDGDAAWRHVDRIARNGGADRGRLKAYPCGTRDDAHWHIGHRPRGKR